MDSLTWPGLDCFGAIHKRRRNILGGPQISMLQDIRRWGFRQIGWNSDMGEGGIKNGPKIPTSFMDGPLEEVNILNRKAGDST